MQIIFIKFQVLFGIVANDGNSLTFYVGMSCGEVEGFPILMGFPLASILVRYLGSFLFGDDICMWIVCLC